MSRSFPTRRLAFGALLVVFVVGACAGSTTILSKVGAAIPDNAGVPAPSAGAAAPGENLYNGGSGGGDGLNAPARDDAKIVRTGSMSLQVTDLATAVRSARDAIRAVGGYVAGSRETNDGENSVAEVTYRIPSDRWDEALDAIRKVGKKVVSEQTDAVEVTAQLIDLEARIANLRASEKAFQAIAEKATKISDILEVQNQLTNVRGQIEQLDAQRSHLSDQASYGTMSVAFGMEIAAVTQATKGWNAGEEVDRATASLVDVLQAVTTAGIWFAIVWLPILLIVGVIVGIVAYVLRRVGVMGRREPPPAAEPAA